MAEQTSDHWRRTLRRRLFVAATGFVLWACAIEARLVYLQVYRHADLQSRADRQQMRTIAVPAKRGEILDRHGRILAYSVDADTIYAVPTEIDDAAKAATLLCGALDDCTPSAQDTLTERLSRSRAFVYVRRQAAPDQARRVAQLNLDGIGFMKENRRFYPKKELAAQLLGYVGIDNAGLSGLEASYDAQIRGAQGTMLIQTDARRHAFSRLERPPTAGATMELTIDEYLQHAVERELREGVALNRAAGGTAIVMDPKTGEILALASEPTFNPNAFRTAQESERRNRAVQDLYEPGSTFKVVTASAALEERVMPLDTLIDTNPGQIRFGSRVVREASGHNYGVLSFTDVIVKSSNVGAIKIGLTLGPERLGRYVRRFGFGRALSPDFPAESPGIVWDSAKVNDSALASISMGYQVGVTPLQMVTAISSVANGGDLIEPRVVHALIRDGRRTEVLPKHLGRTVSPSTVAELTTIMEAVVERGTGVPAQIAGYTIAGKTGTAAKLIDGRYSRSDYNTSFVGFLPSRDPVATIIVVIDSPHAHGYYGGPVAGPIFKRIAEATLRHFGVAPTINPAPPVLVARRGLQSEIESASAGTAPSIVTIVGPSTSQNFPDLRGLSAREALRALTRIGLSARLIGDGFVVEQDPPAGTPIDSGDFCRLWLDRLPPVTASFAAQP